MVLLGFDARPRARGRFGTGINAQTRGVLNDGFVYGDDRAVIADYVYSWQLRYSFGRRCGISSGEQRANRGRAALVISLKNGVRVGARLGVRRRTL